MKLPNARFWIWYSPADGWVKLTLKPGETLECGYGGQHEEGWHRHDEMFEYDEDHQVIVRHVINDGRDCDGRLTREHTARCAVQDLRARDILLETIERYVFWQEDVPNHEIEACHGVFAPEWVSVAAWQRDEQAEMAGY
jgi:hypothetical protein